MKYAIMGPKREHRSLLTVVASSDSYPFRFPPTPYGSVGERDEKWENIHHYCYYLLPSCDPIEWKL